MPSAQFVPRVLLARPGLPGLDRHTRSLGIYLRSAGFLTVPAGRGATDIGAACAEGAADVLVLMLAKGDHIERCIEARESLRQAGSPDLPVVVVGVVPAGDYPLLAESGVRRVFGAGEAPEEVARFLTWLLEPKAFMARGAVEAAETV